MREGENARGRECERERMREGENARGRECERVKEAVTEKRKHNYF